MVRTWTAARSLSTKLDLAKNAAVAAAAVAVDEVVAVVDEAVAAVATVGVAADATDTSQLPSGI